jgi:hypothetical protein
MDRKLHIKALILIPIVRSKSTCFHIPDRQMEGQMDRQMDGDINPVWMKYTLEGERIGG